jgi:pimeloyl-ACP methyl ester carboxylesterase
MAAAVGALLLAGCGTGDDAATPQGGEYADAPPPAACSAARADEQPYTPPAGASTTGLGPQAATYELQAPAGRPRGVALVIHGGGWTGVGTRRLLDVRPDAARWLSRGWATANVDYRACADSVGDVLALHDAIRARIGPDAPVVAVGASAGGQLGLLLAALRPDSVRGVVAMAAPTDPVLLAREPVRDPATGRWSTEPTRGLAAQWRGAFGDAWLTTSPVRRAGEIRARVLLARSTGDPLVPEAQLQDLEQAMDEADVAPWVRRFELPHGEAPFPHAGVTADALARFVAAEDALVRPWATGDPTAPEAVADWWGPAPAPSAAPAAPGPGQAAPAAPAPAAPAPAPPAP